MSIVEVQIKSKNGGYFYTRKYLDSQTLQTLQNILKDNLDHKLQLSPFEHIPYAEIQINLKSEHLYVHCFQGLHPDGIILGFDILEKILETDIQNDKIKPPNGSMNGIHAKV